MLRPRDQLKDPGSPRALFDRGMLPGPADRRKTQTSGGRNQIRQGRIHGTLSLQKFVCNGRVRPPAEAEICQSELRLERDGISRRCCPRGDFSLKKPGDPTGQTFTELSGL